jgi:hypothetical protein
MHDVLTEPIRLGDEINLSSPTYVSNKSLHLNNSDVNKDALNEPILSIINSPRTSSDNNKMLRVRFDLFYILDFLNDSVLE